MNRTAALFVSLTLSLPALAQTASAPAPPSGDTLPPLINDLTIRDNDSPMVRAAKATVRNRVGPSATRVRPVVIDNAALQRATGGNVSQSSTPLANLPQFGHDVGAAPEKAHDEKPAGPDPAAVQKRIEQLKDEQRRMAAEAEEVYGSESEDRTQMRLQQIPNEIQEQQRQLQPQPQPQPPQQ